jgi:hypothetical protein
VLAMLSVGLAIPVVLEFVQTGLVPKLPTAVLSVGIMLVAFLSLVCGLILDTVTHSRRELKRLAYLDIPAPRWPAAAAQGTRPAGLASPRGPADSRGRAGNEAGEGRLPQSTVAIS